MKYEQTVETLPTGIMTCFIGDEEVGILEFSPSHIKIRRAEKFSESLKPLKLVFFDQKNKLYQTYIVEHILWNELMEQEFWWEYCGEIQDEQYRDNISFILQQYYNYVVLKGEAVDNSFSKKLIGYPAEKDEIFDEDYVSWNSRQWKKVRESDFLNKILALDVELAVTLDHPQWYQRFLEEDLQEISDSKEMCFERNVIFQKSNRVYIGNQFCHHLFPQKEILFSLMEKALEQKKEITLVFTYLREELRKETECMLDTIYQWCKEKKTVLEILVNDFGMLAMLAEKEEYFVLCYGTLLNRRRKDPRYIYKNQMEEDWNVLKENSLNDEKYCNWLRNKGVKRLEYESGGYEVNLPRNLSNCFQGGTMHLPMYQTNTSQYCTLCAVCENQDRGKQNFVRNCPKYCSSYVCMYPMHLQMIGQYNSLFAVDWNLLDYPEILKKYKAEGMDRIVWNLE